MHKPGKDCVIVQVWDHPAWVAKLGMVVVAQAHIAPHEDMTAFKMGMPHPRCEWQEVVVPGVDDELCYYPITWMRELDQDCDEEDTAIALIYRIAPRLTERMKQAIREKVRGK